MKARLLAKLHGRKVYAFPVHIECGENASIFQDHDEMVKTSCEVISTSAADAADLVAREVDKLACITITVFGPKGGKAARRYWGWDHAIFSRMSDIERNQLALL